VSVMAVELLGRKVGMTQVYGEDGNAVSVTVIEAGPGTVLQIRTPERGGHRAVPLGFGGKARGLAARGPRGHVAAISSKRSKARAEAKIEALPKADCEPPRFIREFRLEEGDTPCEVGQKLTLAALAEVTHVDVVGNIKGRGTAGVMKQHNF